MSIESRESRPSPLIEVFGGRNRNRDRKPTSVRPPAAEQPEQSVMAPPPPKSAARQRHMDEYLALVMKKLEIGQRTYGDRSFSKDLDTLLSEVLEELVDIAGWGAVLAVRIREMQEAIASARTVGSAPAKD